MLRPPNIVHALLALLLTNTFTLEAQTDAPPVDMAEVLQALRAMRQKQTEQVKASKQKALQEVQAAAASGATAANTWEEAVRMVQFEGMPREGAQFREWKEKNGEALRSKEAQNAARLHMVWLGLTLQRSLGLTNKEMLPQVVAHTKELSADRVAMEAYDEALKREKELTEKNSSRNGRRDINEGAKQMHDQILKDGVDGSPVAKVLKLGDWTAVDKWESSPGNYDGIFQKIILPELRAAKDPRIIEYWDQQIRREAETATATKLSFEVDKFNQTRRPELTWNRAQDYLILGQRNRAISEMFGLIKSNPSHPQMGAWIGKLEELLTAKPAG